jgi:hypothetical protein
MGKKMEMRELFSRAKAADMEAGKAAVPPVMVIAEADVLSGAPLPGGKRWVEPEGPCGFAWVNVKPGNSSFARWLVKNGYSSGKSYYGGVDIWVSEFNQSMVRKEAAANAMARVLSEAGIRAYPMSRMD